MSICILVSNLSVSMNNLRLEQLFAPYGSVSSAKVVMDQESGRPQGRITMSSDKDAERAIAALNSRIVEGQALNVSIAVSTDEPPMNISRPRYGNGRSGGGGVRWGRRS